jgi:FXSXX-COOH protein
LIGAGRQIGDRREVAALPGNDVQPEWKSDMVDVSGLSLTELTELAESADAALARSLRRLADDLDQPNEPIAGFNSAL